MEIQKIEIYELFSIYYLIIPFYGYKNCKFQHPILIVYRNETCLYNMNLHRETIHHHKRQVL